LVKFYWQGEVFDSRPIETYTEIFIQIGELVRKIREHWLYGEMRAWWRLKCRVGVWRYPSASRVHLTASANTTGHYLIAVLLLLAREECQGWPA